MISKERLLHLCFDEEDFKHEGFVPARFLVQKRRHVPLETLQKDLRLYLEHLREEVVQLINTDLYDNFLSVSKKLAGIDGELARISEPLPEMVQKVDRAKRKLEDSRATVQQKLLECQAIDQARQFVVLVLKLTIMADKVEDWLEAYSETQGLAQFQRMAVECRQLAADEALLRAATPDQQEERQALLARTARLRLRFEELLDDCFIHVLRMQQELLLTDAADPVELKALENQAKVYLGCYHLLQKEEAVAVLFQTHVCKEVVEKVLSWTATGSHRSAPPEALQPLFRELLQELCRRCLPLVAASQAVPGRFGLTKAVWKCVMDVVVKRMQHIFSPGITNKFHAHYSAAHELLTGLEATITDPRELEDFRHSEEMEAWNSKWLLSVYTALRQKELLGELTALLQRHLQPLPLPQAAEAGFHFAQVHGVHRLLFWLWGEQVWLYPIGEPLMKMTVKALVALERWLAAFWVAPPPAPPPPPPPPVLDEEGHPVTPTVDPAEKAVTVLGLVAGEMQLKDHVALHGDLTRLQLALRTDLLRLIQSRMPRPANAPAGTLEAAVGALCGHSAAIVQRPRGAVQALVVRAVAKECVDTLVPPLKSITSLYRMTKKPIPKRFSFFIPTVLNGLQNFKDACTSSAGAPPKYALPPEVVAECVEAVLAEVTAVYHSEAKALLITARKAEKAVSSLRKKQKKPEEDRPADGSEGKEEMSDTDKIFVQIHLDIQEYGHQAQTLFGMAPDFPPYLQLRALVHRAAWLLGEVAEEPPDALEG